MKRLILSLAAGVVLLTFNPHNASAGFMDKLNEAAKKLQEKTQPSSEKTPAGDRPLHLEDHYTGSCEGKRSATCMDYGELVDQCMDPLRGYRSKLTANLIEKKLKEDKSLNDKLRKNLSEDLTGLREAEKNKSDDPTIAGEKKSQRHLMDISEEDQVYINAEYNTYYQKIYNKCMGADHMGVGHRTEMVSGDTISGEEAVAQLKAKKAKEEEPFNCLKSVAGVRYKVMADMMERKVKTLKLTDRERGEWEADIAAVRKAGEQGGTTMPMVDNPANPYRPITRLTSTEEQMELSTESSKQSQEAIAACQNNGVADIKKPKKKDWSQGSGLVDHSQSPANKNAKKQTDKQYADLNAGRGGSTNLLALRRDNGCYDQIKGHLAKVTADKLESKLKAAGNMDAQKRKEWQEDIAAFREAERAGVDSPNPPDPDNPYRWYDYVTNQERSQINKEHADFNNKIIRECNSKPSGL